MPPMNPFSAGVTRRAAIAGGAVAVGGLLVYKSPLAAALGFDRQDDVYAELLERWVDIVVGGEVSDGNDDYAEAIADQDETAQGHLETIVTEPGSNSPWEDLPLDDDPEDASNMSAVAGRLRDIAVPYATPASEYYGDSDAAEAVAAGVAILVETIYHEGQDQYGNWWDWEIGTPNALMDACVLIGDALDSEVLDEVVAAIDHFIPDPTRMIDDTLESTGSNRVDMCKSVALRGALGEDPDKLALASDSLAGVLDVVQTGDGFHDDGSFIMHRVIAYPGTYGELMVRGMAEMMTLLVDTEWDVAENERERIVEAVDVSYAPFMHGGLMLDSVRGRAISRTGTRDADNGFNFAFGLVSLAAGMPDSQADLADRFRSLAKGWLQRNTFKPLSDRDAVQIATVSQVLEDDSIPAGDDELGHFSFPDSERITHRREGWLYSLAMNSDRVARFEYMNDENLKGWHTGDGFVQVYLDDDLFQFTEDFWPTVDAKRLAGTTVDTAELDPGAGGDIDNEPLTGVRLSGMVSLQGGEGAAARGLGMASMDLRGHESPLRAHKSWLFLEDGVVAAGSGISTESGADRQIETIVDNRNLHDPDDPLDAPLVVDGEEQPDDLDETLVHENVQWAHVGGVGGYVFLAGAEAASDQTLSTLREDRTGAWSDINDGASDTEITRRFLTLWHDHGVDPESDGYVHLHLPGASVEDTEQRVDDPGVEVVELSEDVHAFRVAGESLASETASLTAVNFFAAGSAAGITVDAPCAVLVLEDESDSDPLRVAVSDPSRTSAVVNVELDASDYPELHETDERLSVLSTDGGIHLLAETGGSHGATLSAAFGSGGSAPEQQAVLLEPAGDATVRGGEHADDNFGSEETLVVYNAESDDDTRRAYLSFDVDELDGAAQRAVLWLKGAIPMDPDDREDEMLQARLYAHTVDADWAESDITWNNAPELGEELGDGWTTVYRDWVGIDVTEAVRDADGVVAFALTQDDDGHELVLDSRESDDVQPMLQIVVG